MAGVKKAVRRSRSGPQSQSNSTDVVVVPATVGTLCGIGSQRCSFSARAIMRRSRPVGIDLDSPEWEKRVMNSWPKKCTFVVREVLMTERAYIASLDEIILGYMMPLHGYLLSQGEGPNFIHAVFSNINKLRQLHEKLLDELYAACGDPHEFAEVFIETDFGQYREYCTHFTDANLFLLKTMADNEKLKLFITQCQQDLEHQLPLHSHLIKPVQRILKYQLMLQEMLKYIDEGDVIHPDVKEAMTKMKNVAEEINTSFKDKKIRKMATPSVIAHRRSKEINDLQRSRSEKRQQTVPDEPTEMHSTTELQRSVEFEDSLTLLRSNRNDGRAFKTVGPGRKPWPPLNDLIGYFQSAKPAHVQGFLRVPSPASPTHSLAPPHAISKQSSPECSDTLTPKHPNNVIVAQREHRNHVSNSESATVDETPSEVSAMSKKSPIIPHTRKQALTLQKSAPVVQRSKVEAQGERGDRSSLLRDVAHTHGLLPGKGSTVEKDESEQDAMANKPVGSEIPDVGLTSPPQHYSPPATTGKKRPLLPPKPAILPVTSILPDKPLHIASRKPLPPQRHIVACEKSVPSQHNMDKKFVIDVTNGVPVVSLPPALQAPPSPPPTTLRPSMLRPSKTSMAVLARQEQMINELIKGRESRASGAKDRGQSKKVPLLPPTAI